jgi:hypothetical protein
MTYGAKGNAALLGRYGFCVPNNIEPDGSCNDILEVEINPNNPPVEFQRGPKSYSYAPFAKALELCRDVDNSTNVPGGDCNSTTHHSHGEDDQRSFGEEDGGLEDFLDSCDNELHGDDDQQECDDEEDDEENDFCDYLYNSTTNSNAEKANSSCQLMKEDLKAIDRLVAILQNVKTGCLKNPLISDGKILQNKHPSIDGDRYCAILLHSEVKTADFYIAAAKELCSQLEERIGRLSDQSTESLLKSQVFSEDDYNFDNKNDVHDQVKALVDAYLSIRYPQTLHG